MTPEEAQAGALQLQAQNGYRYVHVKDAEVGECLIVHRLVYHATLMRCYLGYEGIEERWCYRDVEAATTALREWQGRGWQGEPAGWHRHPSTGRRRVEGDPTTEYIDW